MSARDILSRSTFRLVPRSEQAPEAIAANEAEEAHVSAPLALAKVLHHEQVSRRTGEAYGLSALVSGLLGVGRSLFIHHDVIPAGRRASGRHFHTERDEVVIVLEGEISYVHAGVRRRARRGDAVGFPRGEDYAHAIENRTRKRAVVLVIANVAPGDVTIHVDADRPNLEVARQTKTRARSKLRGKARSR